MDNLYQNWPVYLFLGGFVVFVIFAAINSKQQEKKDKEAKAKEKTTQN